MSCVPGAGDLSTILQVLVQQQESLSNDSNEPDSRQLVLAQISHLNTSKTAVGSRAAAHRDIRRAIKQSSLSSRCATLSADQATIILRRHARRSAFTRNPEYSDWPVLEATAFCTSDQAPVLAACLTLLCIFHRCFQTCFGAILTTRSQRLLLTTPEAEPAICPRIQKAYNVVRFGQPPTGAPLYRNESCASTTDGRSQSIHHVGPRQSTHCTLFMAAILLLHDQVPRGY